MLTEHLWPLEQWLGTTDLETCLKQVLFNNEITLSNVKEDKIKGALILKNFLAVN